MELNPTEWNQAQNLLIKLVQTLSPLAVRSTASSEFLSRRFFIPPKTIRTAHFFEQPSVKILVALYKLQREVEDWVADSGKAAELGHASEKPAETKPLTPKPIKSPQELRGQEKEKKREGECLPLFKQAKELIHQVQDAIGMLANSNYMQEPSETPLRDLLKKLKPGIDRIIETVVISKEKPLAKPLLRHPIPIPLREELIKKLHACNDKGTVSDEKQFEQNEATDSLAIKRKTDFNSTNISEIQREDLKPNIPEKSEPPLIKKPQDVSIKDHLDPKEQKAAAKQEIRPIALPIAPQLFERKPPAPKKKKRKGFWFREEKKGSSDH